MSQEKIALLRAYGAEVVITPTAVEHDSPESYYSVSDRLAEEIPGGFKPDQYSNLANPEAHYQLTGPEIWEQTRRRDRRDRRLGRHRRHDQRRRPLLQGAQARGADRRRRSGGLGLHGEGRRRPASVPRRGHRQGHVAGDDGSRRRRRVGPRLGPPLVPVGAPARARGGHPRRRLGRHVGLRGRADRAAARRRQARADDDPRLGPQLPLEVLRRQLDARARLPRAPRAAADGRGGAAREARRRPPGARHDRRAPEGRRGHRHDAALQHLAAAGRARRRSATRSRT